MSWAAHDPETYDNIIHKGIMRWIGKLLDKYHITTESTDIDTFIDVVQGDSTIKGLYENLRRLAHKEINDAEQDYFSDQWSRMHTHD